MKRTLMALTVMTGAFAFPVLAQDAVSSEGMACADFTELTADEQMTAMSDVDPAPGDLAADEHTASEESATAVVAACTEHPDMMLGDAMKEALRE
jgi:hypothetical protein